VQDGASGRADIPVVGRVVNFALCLRVNKKEIAIFHIISDCRIYFTDEF
jgi:hypothetical protein